MKELELKAKLLKAAQDLLNEVEDPESITTRQLAQKAGVGIGLINYHFQSKDKLLNQAIGDKMTELAEKLQRTGMEPEKPLQKLKNMLIELSDYGVRFNKLTTKAITFELMQGNIQTPLYLIPVLREIFESKDEIQLRIIAFEIITTLQAVSLRPKAFELYTGINLYNKVQRDSFIETILTNLVK